MNLCITRFAILAVLFSSKPTLAQEDRDNSFNSTEGDEMDFSETVVVPPSYYAGGSAGVEMNDMYYFISAEYQQNATQNICFVDSVLPPEMAEQICPGGEEIPFSQCEATCKDMGIETFTNCPLNLAGCCKCPFFSFHANNLDAGNLYSYDEPNLAWTGIPGWFNLGIWIVLTLGLSFLLVTSTTSSSALVVVNPKLRRAVINGTRSLALIGSIIFAFWILVYLVGLNGIGYQGLYVWKQTAAGVFMHVTGSAIWLLTGVIQFIGPIRRRWPRLHRINGWVFVAMALISFLGLALLVLAPHLSSFGGTLITFFFGAYWLFCLGLSLKYAIQRKIDAHRVWMTRHMFMGASVGFQRIFNIAEEWFFKDPQYYVGSIYEPACIDSQGLEGIQVLRQGQDPASFNAAQTEFFCNGVQHLYSSLSFSLQFIICLFVVGMGGAELWLWACRLREDQRSVENAQVSINLSDLASGKKVTLHRKAESMPIVLAERTMIAEDTALLRFHLPSPSDAIVVPLLGHVNLWKEGMARPRPYSPIKAIEPGYVSFYVRNTKKEEGLSYHMVERMELGDKLFLSGPEAPIVTPLTRNNNNNNSQLKKTLILAAGTGIAPFLSLLDVADDDDQQHHHVLVLDRSKERAIGLDEYSGGGVGEEGGNNNTRVEYSFDRKGYIGRVDELIVSSVEEEQAVGTKKPGWDAIFICGPPAFNLDVQKHVKNTLSASGHVDADSIVFALGTDDR